MTHVDRLADLVVAVVCGLTLAVVVWAISEILWWLQRRRK